MFRASLTGLDKEHLRLWLAAFFLALAIPTGILIHQAYGELKWEAFHQHRVLAEELAARIDERLFQMIKIEEARSFPDYSFFVVAGDPNASFLQRSPLSAYPIEAAIPGLIGYFQVDAQGRFSTPLVPQVSAEATAYGIGREELTQRMALQHHILQIMRQNRLVQVGEPGVPARAPPVSEYRQYRETQTEAELGAPATSDAPAPLYSRSADGTLGVEALEEGVASQAAFDRLKDSPAQQEQKKKQEPVGKLGRVEDLKLDYSYQAESAGKAQGASGAQAISPQEQRSMRKERSAVPRIRSTSPAPAPLAEGGEPVPAHPRIQVSIFDSEIDPFEFSLLDSGHFVLYRKVWRDGQRYIQGALIDQQPFLQGVIDSAFRHTVLSQMSDVIVAYRGSVFSTFGAQTSRGYLSSAEELSGAVLYQTRLSAPLGDLELLFSVTRLPVGPGGTVITWVAAVLLVVLCGGFFLMYRLGAGQIELARQQQDFVSAVSHELKTPLTSIRMYGEMLREGWAPDEKKETYYDYIFDESERLSRLITNVLQLARMTRNDLQVDLRPLAVGELMDGIRSKVSSQIERAGFTLNLNCEKDAAQAMIQVDPDWFTQIIINLVDNALKFSTKAQTKIIDLACRLQRDGSVLFSVRDYGTGIPADQMKKIFKLFYRAENELTRETVGTGIGLALVQQLAATMNGRVDVLNAEPGAKFRLSFSTLAQDTTQSAH